MIPKIKIPKEKIIHFNDQYVYWKDGKKIFRGKRIRKNKSTPTQKETGQTLAIATKTIKRITELKGRPTQKTLNALSQYGIKKAKNKPKGKKK